MRGLPKSGRSSILILLGKYNAIPVSRSRLFFIDINYIRIVSHFSYESFRELYEIGIMIIITMLCKIDKSDKRGNHRKKNSITVKYIQQKPQAIDVIPVVMGNEKIVNMRYPIVLQPQYRILDYCLVLAAAIIDIHHIA